MNEECFGSTEWMSDAFLLWNTSICLWFQFISPSLCLKLLHDDVTRHSFREKIQPHARSAQERNLYDWRISRFCIMIIAVTTSKSVVSTLSLSVCLKLPFSLGGSHNIANRLEETWQNTPSKGGKNVLKGSWESFKSVYYSNSISSSSTLVKKSILNKPWKREESLQDEMKENVLTLLGDSSQEKDSWNSTTFREVCLLHPPHDSTS